jgi:hypothetical protein
MDAEQRHLGKRARLSVNVPLRAFYKYWLYRFEQDNERFFAEVMRFAAGSREASPRTVPAE